MSADESKTSLVENNSREELDALATSEGLNPEDYSTKDELADAIVSNRASGDAAASPGSTPETLPEQPDPPNEDEVNRAERDARFLADLEASDHLDDDQKETAKAVYESLKENEDRLNEIFNRGYFPA